MNTENGICALELRSRLRFLSACASTPLGVALLNEKKNDQAYRAISTSQLNALLHLHTWPINVVVFHGPDWENRSCRGLHAYMLSAFILAEHSYPAVPLA